MNRNQESHFAELPHVDIERSIFDRSSGHKTSFNVGELIPFFWDEVLPGDTFNVSTGIVARLQTLLTPIMDNVYMDTYYFFVPNRLCWSHWKEFMGENTDSAWIPTVEYSMPKIASPDDGWLVGTIADYMGIPVNVPFNSENGLMPSALPFRAYSLICNEWFRDQNLTDPLNISIGDANQAGSNGDDYINDVPNGGKPFKVAKYHDYFTSCLPSPQKGPAVGFDLTTSGSVRGIDFYHSANDPADPFDTGLPVVTASTPLYYDAGDSSYRRILNGYPFIGRAASSATGERSDYAVRKNGSNATLSLGSDIGTSTNLNFLPENMYVSTSGLDFDIPVDFGFTINELRLAFQLQKFYEKNARGGSRYRELLKSHFGVNSPDARMMIPEYLGGHRFPLSIHQIENQSQGENDFLGDLGAMSNTVDINSDFVKSFTEHGFVIGVCCVRYDHSYPQGLAREWTRSSALDYYWPVFANIGEQPVYKYEINAEGYAATEGEEPDYEARKAVFGYQEAWASYRYKPNRVSGEMRPGINNSLASWHLADYYQANPSLSDSWIREDKTNVDRVLAVTSQLSNQVFCDFYVKNICTRPMPMYSIPGLIDHH